jgi:hypothetical protein
MNNLQSTTLTPPSLSPLSLRVCKTIRYDPVAWAYSCGIQLRPYRRGVVRAIKASILNHLGLTFVVVFPRQSGMFTPARPSLMQAEPASLTEARLSRPQAGISHIETVRGR